MIDINKLLYEMSENKGIEIKKLITLKIISYEQVVDALLKTNNSKLIINFAKYIGGPLLNKIEDEIVKVKDAYDLLAFAEVRGSNTIRIAHEVIKRGDARVMYLFCVNVKNAPIKELVKGIIASKDAQNIYFTSIYIYKSNIEEKEKLLKILTDGIIESKNARYIYYYALNIKTVSLKELSYAISESFDLESIYNFIVDIEGEYVNVLIKRLIELKAIDYILKLALLEKNYSNNLREYIINLGNKEYIRLLMLRTKNEILKSYLENVYLAFLDNSSLGR